MCTNTKAVCISASVEQQTIGTFGALAGKYFVQEMCKLAGQPYTNNLLFWHVYEKNTGNVYVCSLQQQSCEGQKTCRLKNLRNAESKNILSPTIYTFYTDQPILKIACTSKYWIIILFLVEFRKVFCKYLMQRGNK